MVFKCVSCVCNKQLLLALVVLFSVQFSFGQNAIVTENALTGNPATEWDVSGAGDLGIQGFGTDISANKGGTISFKIDVNTNSNKVFGIKIYRLGYYQGNGARLIADLGNFTGIAQNACAYDNATGLMDCSNWTTTTTWTVPSTAVSGLYIAKLTRPSAGGGGTSHIAFIVRDDAANSPMLFKTSDATWQAYNVYGGNSLYVGSTSYPAGHAAKVSYNRPYITRNGGGGGGVAQDWLFNAEYPMIRFLERNGYNMTYSTDVDMDRSATAITPAIHKVLLSVGHDEYWSAIERTKFENARAAGVHEAFFSGNEVYWKTRWENNNRTLVCYKEGTLGENVTGTKSDPVSTSWTGLWRDGCPYPAADGCKPENALTGEISWAENTAPITVPAAYKSLRFWRNTTVASLAAGQTATLADGTIGYEWDFEQYPDSYPGGRITLSSTTIDSKTHKLSLYKHASGALVFGAGTVQWSWGLDNKHDNGSGAVNVAMQQATVNLFADMGVQPASLQSGLVAASASTDNTAPVAAITSPANGASVAANSTVNIAGTASDVGGVLAGVEVSVDGGTTWKPATGTTSWTYTWIPSITGSANIKVRGFDDSGNIGVPGAAGSSSNITVTVTASTAVCPCNIFQNTTPAVALENDGTAIEVGLKFRAIQNGFITGIRFYKGTGNGGTHIGHLWSSTGTKMGEATFTGETTSGWQQVSFTTPVSITAGVTYVASYFSSTGAYSYTNPSLTAAVVNGPLRALANGEDGPNGVYIYTAASAFPTSNFQTSNYFVDVIFNNTVGADVTPPTVSSVTPLSAATGVSTATAVTANFSEAINAASVTSTTYQLKDATNAIIAATVTTSNNQIILTPSAALAGSKVYTATIKSGTAGVKDLAGNALAADYTWSFTTGAVDVTPPTVSTVSPANTATNISSGTSVIVTFSEAVSAASVTTATYQLKNSAGTVLTSSVATSANQITLTPSAALTASASFTVVVKSGTAGVKDLAGNALAADFSSTFTTAAAGAAVTLFKTTDVPATPYTTDGTALEIGFKFQATQSGYISGIRFYKGTANTGTHIGHLWSSTGTKLGEATFTTETASGWQQVNFAAPVSITANTTYVASYFSSGGGYAITNPYFTQAVINGPLRGLANGEDGPNGLYIYTAASAFPTANFQTSNYWVDVVFNSSVGPDVTPPVVSSVSPVNGGAGVSNGTTVTATFNEPVSAATVTSATFQLKDAANASIPGTITVASGQITFTPSTVLTYAATYTATIKGGSSGVKDVAGNALATDYTWTFTIANQPAPPATDGAGGPILVVSSAANPFSRYTIEILRAEGLNEFLAKDISQVTATDLNNYDVVVLGEQTINSTQASMFTTWVNAGGTLIAFRPSTSLSSLFGITKGTGTLTDQYLLVNTASGPGSGIVAQTIQFHGDADLYTLSGATSLASLYSNATTATTNPAITSLNVGANGGRAIAFTYDLAKSVVYTRQGNPAWAGQKRDGEIDPIRSDDMFFGGTSPDWIDFNKVAIPQADEQQRLLTNIILQGNLHRKPLPRFWFLPRGLKAAIVMTGDDHATLNGTVGRFNQYLTLGPNTATDVADWKAIRGTSYVFPNVTMTNAQAVSFQSQGFEIALHPNTNCTNFTLSSLQTTFDNQLDQFKATFPGVTSPVTSRNHCLVWSDWASNPKVELQNGMRMDVTYYYWPAEWIQNRPGMFTGSGMPMRFADIDGSLIDVYQAPTQMTDESGITVGPFCDALLDKAVGPEGYYGVFTANMHTDTAIHTGSNAIIASAQAHQIPVIAANQMLTWLDGRNGSSFGTMTWSNNQLTFPITALSGARNLNCMLPINSANGQLTSITVNGTARAFTTQTIKGMQYAFFDVTAGTNTYVATYSGGTAAAPVVTASPAAAAVCAGTNASFSSTASGTPAPTVQWQQSTNGTTWTNITNAINSTYTFTTTSADNAKQFRAVWTNSAGPVNSSAATLTVNAVPVAPTVTVTNNCGTSVLTASAYTGSLLWSNAATTPSITVSSAATYTVMQTVTGCASPTGSGIAAPKVAPVLSSSLVASSNSGAAFSYTATSTTTGTTFSWSRTAVSGISNTTATGTGNVAETLINTTSSPVNVTYIYTLTANGCTNSQNVVVTVGAAQVTTNCGIIGTSITSTFNSTAITAGRYIWFNGVFDPSTIGTTGTVNFNVTNATVTFTANSQQYTLSVPNAHILFSSSVTTATTAFTNNVWQTQVPLTFSGNVFFAGLSYLVPARIAGNLTNIKWTANVSIDKPGVSITWKWSAAVYSTFAANSGINVKPIDGLVQSAYLNSDKGGTPENFKTRLVSGAKGTGGTNYTGTYTSTNTVACTVGSRLVATQSVLPALTQSGDPLNDLNSMAFSAKAIPNPTTQFFELVIRSNNEAPVTVILRDIFGRVLQKFEKIGSNNTLRFGQTWTSGTYFAEVVQGTERQMVKMIKIN